MKVDGKYRFDEIMASPANCFEHPDDVLKDDILSDDEKYKILKQWESDARSLAVAEEENMVGGERNLLQEVLLSLKKIADRCEQTLPNDHKESPTKSG